MSNRKDIPTMHKLRVCLLATALVAALAGCKTNTSPGNIVAGKVAMQLAVGSFNDSAGTISGLIGGAGAGTFLNAVATFRGQFGASAFLNPGSATLTGPGLSLGVGNIFAYGQNPFTPTPCANPDCATDGAVGMPPAYSPASTNCPVVCGYALGFIYTSGAPLTAGQYNISTTVSANGQNQNYSASATLPAAPTVLPNEPVPSYVSGGAAGGGTFAVSVPAGVTETVIFIFQGGVQVAAVQTKTSTVAVPPGTLAIGAFQAFAVGADYPFVEAGPPANASVTPALTGAGGTADLTVSGLGNFTQ